MSLSRLAYLSTAALDGETNLKIFEAKRAIIAQGGPVLTAKGEDVGAGAGGGVSMADASAEVDSDLAARLAELSGRAAVLRCDLPNAGLYDWNGSVTTSECATAFHYLCLSLRFHGADCAVFFAGRVADERCRSGASPTKEMTHEGGLDRVASSL